jgi:hypothetical protein
MRNLAVRYFLINFMFFFLCLFNGSVSAQNQQAAIEPLPLSQSNLGATPLKVNTLYGESRYGGLYTIDKNSGISTYIGSIGYTVTDIAFNTDFRSGYNRHFNIRF